MPTNKSDQFTPAGRLNESRLSALIGYQIAQADIAAIGVFERQVGKPMGLRPVEFAILTLVCENPGVTSVRLANALALSAPSVTAWLDKLEARTLIVRRTGESDRRRTHLHATQQGQETADQAIERVSVGEQETFRDLTQGERMLLVELLHKVASRRGS